MKQKTAAQYLADSGWYPTDPSWRKDSGVTAVSWSDTTATTGEDESSVGWVPQSTAVVIQRARDAADERKAWVAFAAAAIPTVMAIVDRGSTIKVNGEAAAGPTATAALADELVAAYRARFAVEIVEAKP